MQNPETEGVTAHLPLAERWRRVRAAYRICNIASHHILGFTVKLALPERPVVALIGDGSAMYTCQALWTAARYRIDCVFVILNNSSYRILKQRLHAMRGLAEQADSYVGMELLDPKIDFVGLARSLGIKAERAKTVHEATDLVAQGLKGGGALLIDVELDRAFKPM